MPSALQAAQPLLASLSAALGQQVALDRHGECALAFDDDVEIVIAQTQDSSLLTIRGAITAAGRPIDTDTLRSALAVNHAHLPPGYTVSLDADSDQIMLLAVLSATELAADAFVGYVEGFVALVPELRLQLMAPVRIAQPDSMLLQRWRA